MGLLLLMLLLQMLLLLLPTVWMQKTTPAPACLLRGLPAVPAAAMRMRRCWHVCTAAAAALGQSTPPAGLLLPRRQQQQPCCALHMTRAAARALLAAGLLQPCCSHGSSEKEVCLTRLQSQSNGLQLGTCQLAEDFSQRG